jgi:thioesterase domain-containing protein/acyl carrier protein
VAVESKAAEKYLVSYIVSAEVVKPEILKDFISGFLPLYMVPQFVEQLNQLPRNINGKLDRFNLPPPKHQLLGYAPPEGETEEKLAQLWAATLGLDNASISRDSDFLKLGGDSLRAAILAFEISNVMGLQFSPGEIVKTPVLREQAAIVALAESFQPVFVFSDAGDGKAPLFFVHGGNIGPETLTELAKNLPPDRSFYCFENYNVNHPHARIKGIQAVARHYIKIMRKIAPRFPCALGGWSYGGLVAFEMACQLEQAGDTVEHLYLMDPSLIISRQERELNEKLIATNSYLEYLARDPWFERFRAMGLFERLSENYRELTEDILEYLPAVLYRGKLTLFKATRPDPVGPDVLPEAAEIRRQLWQITSEKKDNGFGEYAPQLRVVEIDDSHDKLGRGDAAKKIASVIGRG